jgi:hypothetical protein
MLSFKFRVPSGRLSFELHLSLTPILRTENLKLLIRPAQRRGNVYLLYLPSFQTTSA